MHWDKILLQLFFFSTLQLISARHINISWNDAILGSVVNMDNDLENYLSGTWKGYKYGLKSKWD